MSETEISEYINDPNPAIRLACLQVALQYTRIRRSLSIPKIMELLDYDCEKTVILAMRLIWLNSYLIFRFCGKEIGADPTPLFLKLCELLSNAMPSIRMNVLEDLTVG